MMEIQVNGQRQEVEANKTLQGFITEKVKNNKFLVAELNGQIIKEASWDQTQLSEGDSLELVTLFGGG